MTAKFCVSHVILLIYTLLSVYICIGDNGPYIIHSDNIAMKM